MKTFEVLAHLSALKIANYDFENKIVDRILNL